MRLNQEADQSTLAAIGAFLSLFVGWIGKMTWDIWRRPSNGGKKGNDDDEASRREAHQQIMEELRRLGDANTAASKMISDTLHEIHLEIIRGNNHRSQ